MDNTESKKKMKLNKFNIWYMRGNGKFIYQKWIMNIGSVTDRERDR